MQAVVLAAIDEYIERRQHGSRVGELAGRGAEQYREALDRLGSI
jgi:hypothetical protein